MDFGDRPYCELAKRFNSGNFTFPIFQGSFHLLIYFIRSAAGYATTGETSISTYIMCKSLLIKVPDNTKVINLVQKCQELRLLMIMIN